ncbi:ribokinase [Dokdonella sp.]|uniref:ribokinase n=1 Tax=Dokdonella sp. TaxID=2291710 RepID=UPI0025C0CF50|nr:ribokinase [Dokdonella sp.]MBX3687813.1 ribokinase [Dokdonella sp.]
MSAPQVIVVGSYNQDYAWHIDRAPQAGETRRGEDFHSAAGGKGFNQAVACARQGVATAFIAALGDDAAGRCARELAAAEAIDARWLLHSDAATGSACIVVEAGGQNRIIVALGANERLDPAFVQAQTDAFDMARVLLAQLENNIEATRAAFALARSRDLVRVLNPAPVHAQLDAALLADVDILTPNETEFALLLSRLCGIEVDPDQLVAQDDANLHRLARRLGVGTLVITLGAHGCFVSHAGGDRRGDALDCYRLAAAPAKVLDTTGAGDALSGALAAGLVRFAGQPFRVVIEHANRCAALATEGRGAASAMADFAAVRARFGQ